MIEEIYIICIILILSSIFVYPIIIIIIAYLNPIKIDKGRGEIPSVTLLISAYNEESIIENKIKNSLQLDYPREKINIVIINDDSSDNTANIIKAYEADGIDLRDIKGRVGKNICINKIMHNINSDIIIFSDANSIYDKRAVKRLVSNFSNKRVGLVSGELKYHKTLKSFSKMESLYWKYEIFLKKMESKTGNLLGANGAIFAIRRKLFHPLNPKIANDFQLPQIVASNKYHIIYEPEAIAYEKISEDPFKGFYRKTRIVSRGLEATFKLLPLFKGIRFFQLLFHHFLRWFNWLFLIVIFILNIFLLEKEIFFLLFIIQLIFYIFAMAGLFFKNSKTYLFKFPFYVCLVNLSALIGFYKFLTNKHKASWENIRD